MRPPRYFKQVRAATPDDVMMALADFAAQVPGDQEIVEIGVFHGRTALQLAWGARQGQRAHVTAIDLWDMPGNTYGPPFTEESTRRWAHHHVRNLGYSRDITLVQGFSHDVATSYEGLPVGLLFVDGDHSKQGARRDIESWAPHLAPGARIAVDDYGHPDWPGVKQAVDELVAEGVLEPIELFHSALAVTRLVSTPSTGPTTAVTSEGVHPSPYPAAPGQVAGGDRHGNAPMTVTQDEAVAEGQVAVEPESRESPEVLVPSRTVVAGGELDGVAAGTSIDDLNDSQLRELARARDIPLGRGRRTADWLRATLRAGQAPE